MNVDAMTTSIDSIPTSIHSAVLLHESIQGLDIHPGDVYLDGTLGGGGHAEAAIEVAHGDITVIGLDADRQALERTRPRLEKALAKAPEGKKGRLLLECRNFRHLEAALDAQGIPVINRLMLDLGLSSDELENSGRGFSFLRDEPLLMTFGDPAEAPFTAKDIVNDWDEADIANVIYAYGEERYARRIARGIVGYRAKKAIETTDELQEIVRMSVPAPYRRGKLHPATKTFQALRIAVNDELDALRDALKAGWERLSPGGRIAVISFHSLEDRIVKQAFASWGRAKKGKILTKKPIRPSAQEIAVNPRSRSACLRIIEKI